MAKSSKTKKTKVLQRKATFSINVIIVFVLAFGIVGGYAVWQTLAASPNKGGPSTSTSPSLTGTTTDTTYTVIGTGFKPNSIVSLQLAEANGCCIATNGFTDATGTFYYYGQISRPGKYTITASEQVRNRWRAVAEWSFVK